MEVIKIMHKKVVVTIAREFGAEGREIGRRLSEKMGVEIYDKDILEAASKHLDIPVSVLVDADEEKMSHLLVPYIGGTGILGRNFSDQLFEAEKTFIEDIARKESCVIVGRLGDYILKDNPDCIKVYIYAPLEKRIQIVSQKHGISESEAKKLIKRMDMARKDFRMYYTDSKWNITNNKDILLNRDKFGIEGCVEILYQIVKKKREE